jgi:ADP-ribose pyrophosphatase YjhB (NUDIX family)
MSPGHMISYDMAPGRFNFRVAGMAVREDRLLVFRVPTDAGWALPGGRVEWGESVETTLRRELFEELGVTATIGTLRYVMERFFTHDGIGFHELAYYFPVTLPDDFPFDAQGDVCYRAKDGTAELEFKWAPLNEAALTALAFVPGALRGRLERMGEPGIEHIVEHA